jgi:hypothetical protein
MKLRSLLMIATVAMVSSGCTLARIYSTSGNSVSMTDASKVGGESFKLEHRLVFDYTGAVDVQEVLRSRYGSGHQFENLSVKIKQEPIDIIVNIFTLGLAQSKTFEISGDKVK